MKQRTMCNETGVIIKVIIKVPSERYFLETGNPHSFMTMQNKPCLRCGRFHAKIYPAIGTICKQRSKLSHFAYVCNTDPDNCAEFISCNVPQDESMLTTFAL